MALAPYLFAVLLLVFAAETGALSRGLKSRALVALGTWSYSIYMVHFPLMQIIADLQPLAKHDWEMWLVLGTVIAVSAMTYRVIEAPARTYFRNLATRGARVRPEPA